MFKTALRFFFSTTLLVLLSGTSSLQAQDLDALFDDFDKKDKKPNASTSLLDDLIDGKARGYPFDLVPFDAHDQTIDDRLFWRTYKGMITASAIPDEFSVDGEPIMQTTVGQKQILDGPLPKLKPTTGSAILEKPDHVLNPGRIKIVAPGGDPECDHTAVLIRETPTGKKLSIRLAPVVFESQTEDGKPYPFHPEIECEKKALLSKALRFRKLTLWLPIDLTYDSSFGRFQLLSDGAIRYSADEFPPDVTFTGKGFLKKFPSRNNPNNQTIRDPEFLSFRKGSTTIRFYAALTVSPGKPLPLALSKSQFKSVTGREPTPRDISRNPRNKAPVYAKSGKAPSEGLAAYIAEKLNCPIEDLFWANLPLPDLKGPFTFDFNINGLGRGRRDLFFVEPNKGLLLHPHRGRTAFSHHETAYIHLFTAPNFPGGKVLISTRAIQEPGTKKADNPPPKLLETQRNPLRIELPPNTANQYNSHLLTLSTHQLPPGHYQLQARFNRDWTSQAYKFQITRPAPASDFTAYIYDNFINLNSENANRHLNLLKSANIQFVSLQPRLQSTLPHFESFHYRKMASGYEPAPPAELIARPSYNDTLLNTLQQYSLNHIDFSPVRRDNVYGEGYSYYHTYQPSVDRTLRRLHLFHEQTRDYPNTIGTLLGIDPRHQGTRRGFGPATDAHAKTRNEALAQTLAQQNLTPPTPEEIRFLQQNPASTNASTRKKADAIRERAVAYFHATSEATYTKHNPLYQGSLPNHALHMAEEADYSQDHDPSTTFFKQSIYFTEDDSTQVPMSAAFLADWAKGHAPQRPVWLTTRVDGYSEGQVKNLLHAFARGLQGGGIDFRPNEDFAELQRRANFTRFLIQYGSIPKTSKPEARLAILATTAQHRYARQGNFHYNATYNIFTRLGVPPIILHERQLTNTSPKALVLANEHHDLLDATKSHIQKLKQSGTKLIVIGRIPHGIQPDQHIATAPETIYDNKEDPGFGEESHAWMWKVFQKNQKAFHNALLQTGLKPLAQTDPLRGYALTLDDGPIRYVAVIADRANSHPAKFVREPELPLTLDGEWKVVRDLRLQQDLKPDIKGGKTHIQVPLETEPCTLLALLPASLESFDQFRLPVLAKDYDAEDNLRSTTYTSSDNLPSTIPHRKTVVQELLTGLTKTIHQPDLNNSSPHLALQSTPANPTAPITTRPELILLEDKRTDLLPIAQKLAKDLNIPLWVLEPDHFDEHPFRWYPHPADEVRSKEILQAKLVGYRKGLSPYLDSNERHKPELGGYRSLNPPFMVGKHCVLFSGGELGDSLRTITSWMDTPSSPGKGQARILNLPSAFYAGKNVIAMVANDLTGYQAAANALTQTLQQHKLTTASRNTSIPKEILTTERQPVPTPFTNYSAHRHTAKLLATSAGNTAIEFSEDNGFAIVGKDGKTSTAIKTHYRPARLLSDGTMWTVETRGDREGESIFRHISQQGKTLSEFYIKENHFYAEGSKEALTVTPDGKTAIIGRPGEIIFLNLSDFSHQRYDDAQSISHKFSAYYPRVPVSSTFSDNGRYLLTTMDSRPPISGFNRTSLSPTYASTLLFDLQDPTQPLWVLDAGKNRRATYAVHNHFAAVADNGLTALAGFEGEIFLVSLDGQVLARHKAAENQFGSQERQGPSGGVGVSIDAKATLAAYAFRDKLFLAQLPDNLATSTSPQPFTHTLPGQGDTETPTGIPLLEIAVPDGIVSMLIAQDGTQAYYSTDTGDLTAIDPQSTVVWQTRLIPDIHLAHAPEGQLYAADGTGTLHLLSKDGKTLRQNNIWLDAATKTVSLQRDPNFFATHAHVETVPPTLALAKEHLGAKKIKDWEPKGYKRTLHGRTFHQAERTITFDTGDLPNAFLHIVYRNDNDATLNIEVQGNGQHPFKLDLPTPTYRTVNIPIQGPNGKVQIFQSRGNHIAECSLWSFQWPGANLALKSKQKNLLDPQLPKIKKEPSLVDDLLDDLESKQEDPQPQSSLVEAAPPSTTRGKIWWPNTDPFNRDGPFRTSTTDPNLMLDGFKYGISKDLTPAWANYNTFWGASFTIDFEKPVSPTLIATYERTTKQSEVSKALQTFTGTPRNQQDSPNALGTRLRNDQFWQLFPIDSPRRTKTLGIRVFRERGPIGLSEIEVYGK